MLYLMSPCVKLKLYHTCILLFICNIPIMPHLLNSIKFDLFGFKVDFNILYRLYQDG